jgi:asparagine synthase (glutamine-hydrolysing)
MCGIFGILTHDSDAPVDESLLSESARLIEHRGPDHLATYTGPGIGIAHSRLSLLDLSERSNQPFWDDDGRCCIVYNGEVYNYLQLRERLEAKGIRFHTTSDTEVVLKWLIHSDSSEPLLDLEGMFAFALYDKHRNSLLLARDRFGIKPLYVCNQSDAFIFSSEIRAMRPWFTFQPDLLSIAAHMSGFSGPTKGFSFYKDIEIVPPGSIIEVNKGAKARTRQFFSMSDFLDGDYRRRLDHLPTRKVVDDMEEQLADSVRMQLVADVPVGALCSGGVDSSLIMAMAAKSHNNLAVFHANVVGPNSEFDAASALARHLSLDMKSVEVSDRDFLERMPDVMLHYGHPCTYHQNSIPFMMVSQLVRHNNIKAVLSGEGSDECYHGYPHVIFNLAAYIRSFKHRSPYQVFTQLKKWVLRRPTLRPPPDPYVGIASRYETELENETLRHAVQKTAPGMFNDKDLTSLVLLSYHLRTLLHRNDCLGMSAGIEARFPFLDTTLVKTAVNLPYRYKVRFSPTTRVRWHYFLRDKWIIRKIADRWLPRQLSRRRKIGFPVDAYRRMQIAPAFFRNSLCRDLMDLGEKEIDYFVTNASQNLKIRLLHLEVWAHVCLYDLPADQMLSRLCDNIEITPYN